MPRTASRPRTLWLPGYLFIYSLMYLFIYLFILPPRHTLCLPCKSKRKGHATPGCLTVKKTRQIPFTELSTRHSQRRDSVDLGSVTGHLIRSLLALPERKRAFGAPPPPPPTSKPRLLLSIRHKNGASWMPLWILSNMQSFSAADNGALGLPIDFLFIPLPFRPFFHNVSARG